MNTICARRIALGFVVGSWGKAAPKSRPFRRGFLGVKFTMVSIVEAVVERPRGNGGANSPCGWNGALRRGVCEHVLLDHEGMCPDGSAGEVEKAVKLGKQRMGAEMTKEAVLT